MWMMRIMQNMLIAMVLMLTTAQALVVPVDVVTVLDNSGSMKPPASARFRVMMSPPCTNSWLARAPSSTAR